MIAPTSRDPLVVNTKDGVVWQRRAVTAEGRGLYAVTGSCNCPEFLMATLAELAAHGIAGSADVLPMPVGPASVVPVTLSEAQIDALSAVGNRAVNDANHEDLCMCDAWPKACVSSGNYFQGYWDSAALDTAIPAVLALWESMRGGELELLRARVAELETGIAWRDAERERWSGVCYLVEKAIDKGWSSVDTLDLEDQLGPEPGADGLTQVFAPVAALREDAEAEAEAVRRSVDAQFPVVAAFLAKERVATEDPHDSPLHQTHRIGRDLPEMGGA